MKLFVLTATAILFSTMAFADITIKPDGTITCTGKCDGVITGGGTYTVCQGNTCVTISGGGGLGSTKFPEKRPGDEK